MQVAALEVQGLTKQIGSQILVDNLSFSVQQGEIFGLLGPNGAGKTTTIRMIVGLMSKTKGSVHLQGLDIDENFIQAMMHIGAIVENPEMIDFLSGYQNLVHYARMARVPIPEERITELVHFVNLEKAIHAQVKTYSLGMKQRLGVAQALLHRPSVLILDEPTNGLDPQGMYELREHLRSLATAGTTVLVSSHLLSEMQLMCDRVAIIQHGKLTGVHTVEELTGRGGQAGCVHFEVDDRQAAQKILAKEYPEVRVKLRGEVLELTLTKERIPFVNEKLVKANIAVFSITSQHDTLEAKFLEMTQAGEKA